ncbi:MAG: hypothetical protein ACJAVK_000957 [Akkermansiaceae bacterium]|jgi:hypothetical protein
MFSVSDLSKEQIETIKNWVADGAQMADVQKRLKDDLGFSVTYIDTRFLSLDLELAFEVEEEEVPEVLEGVVEESVDARVDATVMPDEASMTPMTPSATEGGVHATVDQVARPGAMVSGTVTFSDGMKAIWLIDEMGRPSIDPDQAGYQPTEADLVSFQSQLQTMLDGHV